MNVNSKITAVRLPPGGFWQEVELECGHKVQTPGQPQRRPGDYEECVLCTVASQRSLIHSMGCAVFIGRQCTCATKESDCHTGWLPIDQAPRDGTRVHLGFAGYANFDVIAHWTDGDWALNGTGKYAERLEGRPHPTHFRMLPAPPRGA